jgi:Ca2+-binding RTX toxin-like protein
VPESGHAARMTAFAPRAWGGNDLIYGGDGDDQLWGGDGVNTLEGGAGDDYLGIDAFFAIAAGNIFDGGSGYDTLEPVEGVDISAATLISIEEIRISGGPVLMTVAQMNGVSALHAIDSLINVSEFTLTDAGAVALSGKSVWETSFILSNAGNMLDLTGAIIGDAMEREGFSITGRDGSDSITAAGGIDRLVGGAGDAVTDGAGGNDILRGDAGRDTVRGGAGNDSFFIDEASHLVAGEIYDGGSGTDAIYLPAGNFDLSALGVTITGIEEITLGAGVLSLSATQLSQFNTFGAGTYMLTSAGNVSLVGDKLLSDASFILSDLGNGFDLSGLASGRGDVTGGLGADYIIGSKFDDILAGGGGDDVILGGAGNDQLTAGAGADNLYGGLGNDSYFIENSSDLVFENAGEGIDTINVGSDFYLYANVENLTLTGSADIYGVGNDLDNQLLGNNGENLLIGAGGIDTIRGGGGRDAIFGGDGADRLFGGAGIDYIVAGAGHDIVVGDAGADEIYGEDGNDTLTGGGDFATDILVGGAGNDTLYGNSTLGDYDLLYGNTGDDSFYVDTPDDLVFENAGEGIDTVIADIEGAGYYLYDNIENLGLVGDTPFGVGNALDNRMTGSDSDNYLLGGAGNDTLNGLDGNDVLFGEAGDDVFVFMPGTGADVIGDFAQGEDVIDLSAYGFTDFSQLSSRFVQDGDVGAIQFANGDVVVLHHVQMSALTADDFIL